MISNIFLFNSNKFVFSKKQFYHIYLFRSSKIYSFYVNSSFNTFPILLQHEDVKKLLRRILEYCAIKVN